MKVLGFFLAIFLIIIIYFNIGVHFNYSHYEIVKQLSPQLEIEFSELVSSQASNDVLLDQILAY